MIGWWVAPEYRRWQARSSHEKVEASTRWMLAAYAWLTVLGFVVQLVPNTDRGALADTLAWAVFGTGLVQCLVCTGVLHQALDTYLGTRTVAPRQLALPAALVGAMTALTLTLAALDAVEGGGLAVGLALHGTTAPFAVVFGVTVGRGRVAVALCGFLAVLLAGLAATGMPWSGVLAALVIACLGTVLSVFTARSSAWYIAVIRELEEARGVQARLAVTEERLRFSRDLHDVMGRNLSAIALKSELAAQLARRGGAEDASVEQMTEVQRIARESQSEVRAVVRGYRDVDLATELQGARGILRAAGVDCRADNGGSRLPVPVQAALGWVVREGATNVLRHADATWCTVWVGADSAGGTALLVMENDGVRAASGAGARKGSGLEGLRERLDGVGGTLRVERDEERGTFRLTAEVPLGAEDARRAGRQGGADDAKSGDSVNGPDVAKRADGEDTPGCRDLEDGTGRSGAREPGTYGKDTAE